VIRSVPCRLLALATLAVAGAPAVAAQETQVVDRVVAVIGNHPVLESEVQEELFARQSQGLRIPAAGDSLARVRRAIIDELIDNELLIQQASADTSIKVTDQEVAAAVEQAMASGSLGSGTVAYFLRASQLGGQPAPAMMLALAPACPPVQDRDLRQYDCFIGR